MQKKKMSSALSCDRSEMIFFSAPEGFSLANCANSSGVRFTLFKNASSFLSYGSLVARILIAAENNSKLSPRSKDLSIFPAFKFFIVLIMTNRAIKFLDSAQNRCGFGGTWNDIGSLNGFFPIDGMWLPSFKVLS